MTEGRVCSVSSAGGEGTSVVHRHHAAGTSHAARLSGMCRNIRPLFSFDPPANDEEMHAASLQFVRKIAGTTSRRRQMKKRSRAVDDVHAIVRDLLDSLVTTAPLKNREVEAQKRREASARRFG